MSKADRDLSVCGNASVDLSRFVAAQSSIYDTALAEIRARRKGTHWMWFIFPQLRGLGSSDMAVHYGIRGLDEARAYMAHVKLGPRLIECTVAMCSGPETDAKMILGDVDAAKFRSCMTLFEVADYRNRCFADALRKFFDGMCDHRTLSMV